jgi:hypothetical protein
MVPPDGQVRLFGGFVGGVEDVDIVSLMEKNLIG